jgi:hypothetical protein
MGATKAFLLYYIPTLPRGGGLGEEKKSRVKATKTVALTL